MTSYRAKINKMKKDIAKQKERLEYEKLKKQRDTLRRRR
jgi:hypothetical protein